MTKTAEDLLERNLMRCADSIAQRLANADAAPGFDAHNCEMNAAVALLNASARLADALARLRGQTIRVTRDGGGPPARDGSNGP